MTQAAPWHDFTDAVALLRDAPQLNGVILKMRPGPVWERALEYLTTAFPDVRRWPASFALSDLTGGIDSTATLAAGHVVRSVGLLERKHPILIPSAERLSPQAAALIAQAMDAGTAPLVILIDESAEGDEQVAPTLTDRIAFHCDLSDLSLRDPDVTPTPALMDPTPVEDPASVLTTIALRLGVFGLRAPMFALTTSHALGGDTAALTRATALVLATRATMIPEDIEDQPPEQSQQPDTGEAQDASGQTNDIPLDDMIIDAVRAMLPEQLLTQTKPDRAASGKGFSGSGSRRRGNRKGRPLPAQAGRLDGQSRLDLVATLRAAVPWQTMRRREQPHRTGVILSPRDIHIQRMEERSDRVLVFAVDASGSSAVARLGEVKGAVELVLAQAYARRDHVALIAFRRDGAETLLPPTRSLVQAKRRLASLPGGGGTPLAAGMEAGMRQAIAARSRGLTPQMILLTDGRGNIAIDGTANRVAAAEDAQRIARHVAASAIDTLVIDTGQRPQAQLAGLAKDMQATYVALPRARAGQISDIVVGAR